MRIRSRKGFDRGAALSIKAEDVKEDGTFSGYGSVFGVVDSYREAVDPGAFKDSLAEWKEAGKLPPVLWQHDPHEPIGRYTLMQEDKRGLWCEGQLVLDNDPVAQKAYTKLKNQLVDGLSIGFYVREDSFDQKEQIYHLKKVDLRECSIVTFPANEEARVEQVKSRSRGMRLEAIAARIKSEIEGGRVPRLSDIEDLLREAGFSKSRATEAVSLCKPVLLRGDPGGQSGRGEPGGDGLAQFAEALRSFKI